MEGWVWGLIAVVLVGIVAAVLAPGDDSSEAGSAEPTTPTITGTFTLTDRSGRAGAWNVCSGRGGYSDFGPGMDVTVTDGGGTIIGVGRTRSLRLADADSTIKRLAALAKEAQDRPTTTGCVLVFEVPLSGEADFYSIEVGRRGELNYSQADMRTAGWYVAFSLGD